MGLCQLLGWFCPLWGLRRLVRVAGPLTQGSLSTEAPSPCPVWMSATSVTWPLCSQCQFQRLDLFLKREDLQPKDFDVILGTLLHIEQVQEIPSMLAILVLF